MNSESAALYESVEQMFENITDDTQLSTVSALARSQLRLHEQVNQAEAETKRLKEELRKIQEDLLPAAMAEFGLSSLELDDGSKISVKPY